ncbi:hypothetical protein [Streptomyces natalensis]|uniref:hypothetical protein n=1 Tax=Streptomyces natalensis TaxID=68242 RepID=UPI00099B32CE|nr:hypothetical protein [Streptomyces natalensis]
MPEDPSASMPQPDSDARQELEPQPEETGSAIHPWAPLRDRTHWATLVVLPLLGAIAFWAVQGLWGWIWDKISGPPGLTAYTSGLTPCAPVTLPLVLQAKTDEAIVVTSVKVHVLSGHSKAGFAYGKDPSVDKCAGTAHDPMFDVNLTQTPVSVVPAVRNAEPDRTDFPFTVSSDHPQQLRLRINPGKRDVRFSLKVEWVADGEYGSATLPDDGRTAS